jgi:uncharacterized protein YraI
MKKALYAALSAILLLSLWTLAAASTVSKLFGDVTMYACPRVDCQPVATLKGGEKVEVIKTEGGWALIRFGQVEGWVVRDYLGTF